MTYPRSAGRSLRVFEGEVQEILEGHRPDPSETTLGSRLEVVARLDRGEGRQPRAQDIADLLGVTKRTVERYRRMIRTGILG